MHDIKEFKLSYNWLSNFYPCAITVNGITYPTLEHAYQASKTDDPTIKHKISLLLTAGQAKRFGRTMHLPADWDERKLKVMEWLLRIKFTNPDFRRLLVLSYPAVLEEGNNWGDRYWGICPPNSGNGENHLGKLLMKLRDELRRTGKLL